MGFQQDHRELLDKLHGLVDEHGLAPLVAALADVAEEQRDKWTKAGGHTVSGRIRADKWHRAAEVLNRASLEIPDLFR